jgi:hypothetical protein
MFAEEDLCSGAQALVSFHQPVIRRRMGRHVGIRLGRARFVTYRWWMISSHSSALTECRRSLPRLTLRLSCLLA